MKAKELNIVYIGPLSFPYGYASTKRRKYMIDYMNKNKISAHVLSTRYKKNSKLKNPQSGFYGETDFFDLSIFFWQKNYIRYYKEGKRKLKEWYNSSKNNILIFHTSLPIEDLFFFLFAKKIGYKIIFDQVETSYKAEGTNISFKRKCYITLNDWISNYAYKKCNGSFVISNSLYSQNKAKYPNMPLCILPNSTPILSISKKEVFNKPMKILYSGTYAPKDGVKFLVEGFIKAINKGINCQLILSGEGNKKDMQPILNRIQNISQIKYIGFVSDEKLIEIMNDCDVLTMTRTNSVFANYGFPFKLSEYLATGNLVLATKVGDVCLYLKHKYDAILIEPESSDQISDALSYISNNEKECIQIANNGLQTMKKYFSINTIGDIFVKFLSNI